MKMCFQLCCTVLVVFGQILGGVDNVVGIGWFRVMDTFGGSVVCVLLICRVVW